MIEFGSDYLGFIENTDNVSEIHLNTNDSEPYKLNSSVKNVILLDKDNDDPSPKYHLDKLKSIQIYDSEDGRVLFLSDHISLANKEFKYLDFYDVPNNFHVVADITLLKKSKVIEVGTVWGGKLELRWN